MSIILVDGSLGCKPHPETTAETQAETLLGTRPFQFNSKDVTELTLVKSDPATGDHWFTSLQKEQDHWKITSSPLENQIDRQADEIFVEHFIDELRSIQVDSFAPHGSLASLGLAPPYFAVRWKTAQQNWEIHIGSALPNLSRYCTFDRTQPLIMTGNALQMLDLIESYSRLRKKTWTLLAPDDLDEIQLFHRSKPMFYAQREGDQWTDRQHHRIKKDLNGLLQNLVQARITQFVDDPETSKRVLEQIQEAPDYEARLSDRHGKTAKLQIRLLDTKVYGFNSTRQSSVFQLEDTFFRVFHQKLR